MKTGETFKPWKLGDLKKELFGSSKTKPSKDRLETDVQRFRDKKGYYFLITLGHDLPMTYEINGRQFVVVTAGGNPFSGTDLSDTVVAFALPRTRGESH